VLAEREPLDPELTATFFDQISLLALEGDAAGLAAKVSELSQVRQPGSSGRLGAT